MALGIEQNNLAPALIQSSGAALVQGIRQIGQQVSNHITELQTKRDLGGLAMEMQGVNPASTEFPVQLTQLVSKHPLAARDERGQMLLSILGKAHGQWQASQADALAFQRQMQMLDARGTLAREQFDYEEAARAKRPVSVPGVGLTIPNDPVTGQPKVLVPAQPRQSSALPFASSPLGIIDRRTGEIKTPAPAKTSSEARMQKKMKLDLLMRQDAATRAEFGRLESRRDALSKQRMEITKADDPNAAYLDNTVKAIEEEAKALKKRREDIQKAIEAIESTPAEEAAVLPAMGEVAVPVEAPTELIAVIDPNGRPGKIKASQLEAALKNGYTRR